jgi:hypothetical protein
MNPAADAIAQIFTIRMQSHAAGFFQHLKCLESRGQFHAVIGGLGLAP